MSSGFKWTDDPTGGYAMFDYRRPHPSGFPATLIEEELYADEVVHAFFRELGEEPKIVIEEKKCFLKSEKASYLNMAIPYEARGLDPERALMERGAQLLVMRHAGSPIDGLRVVHREHFVGNRLMEQYAEIVDAFEKTGSIMSATLENKPAPVRKPKAKIEAQPEPEQKVRVEVEVKPQPVAPAPRGFWNGLYRFFIGLAKFFFGLFFLMVMAFIIVLIIKSIWP